MIEAGVAMIGVLISVSLAIVMRGLEGEGMGIAWNISCFIGKSFFGITALYFAVRFVRWAWMTPIPIVG